jgi:hypothetical protein
LGERPAGNLPMDLNATVLGKSFCECERVKLDVCVPVDQALKECSNDVSSPKWGENGPLSAFRGAYPCSPSSWTLSQRLRMISQFSDVWFSSVALTG